MKNLDLIAAQTAQKIIASTTAYDPGEVDTLITKSLGVLQENGVYAAMLYLYSRTSSGNSEKPIAQKTREHLLDVVSHIEPTKPVGTDATNALNFLTESICGNLNKLLLVKQLWEQTLIYTRYGAKAKKAEKEATA